MQYHLSNIELNIRRQRHADFMDQVNSISPNHRENTFINIVYPIHYLRKMLEHNLGDEDVIKIIMDDYLLHYHESIKLETYYLEDLQDCRRVYYESQFVVYNDFYKIANDINEYLLTSDEPMTLYQKVYVENNGEVLMYTHNYLCFILRNNIITDAVFNTERYMEVAYAERRYKHDPDTIEIISREIPDITYDCFALQDLYDHNYFYFYTYGMII